MPPNIFAIGAKIWPGISKLIEEAGEVQQICGKLLGTGGAEEHWDGSNLRTRLEEEIADLMAACMFVLEMNGFSIKRVEERANTKLKLFKEWHAKQDPTP